MHPELFLLYPAGELEEIGKQDLETALTISV